MDWTLERFSCNSQHSSLQLPLQAALPNLKLYFSRQELVDFSEVVASITPDLGLPSNGRTHS